MIKGKCVIFGDDMSRYQFPTVFGAVPQKGDWVRCDKTKSQIAVKQIEHQELHGEPFIVVHLEPYYRSPDE